MNESNSYSVFDYTARNTNNSKKIQLFFCETLITKRFSENIRQISKFKMAIKKIIVHIQKCFH